MAEVSEYLSQYHTPVDVKTAINKKLKSWLETEATISNVTYDSQSYLDDAISMQENIGWGHFIRGRMAIEWGRIINIHLHNINNDTMTAEKWASNLIDIHYKYSLLLWDARNKEEHGESVEEKEQKKKQRLLEEVLYIKELMKYWPASDLRYLPDSLSTLRSKSSKQLEKWLISARILQKIHSKTTAAIIRSNNKKIHRNNANSIINENPEQQPKNPEQQPEEIPSQEQKVEGAETSSVQDLSKSITSVEPVQVEVLVADQTQASNTATSSSRRSTSINTRTAGINNTSCVRAVEVNSSTHSSTGAQNLRRSKRLSRGPGCSCDKSSEIPKGPIIGTGNSSAYDRTECAECTDKPVRSGNSFRDKGNHRKGSKVRLRVPNRAWF